ncbi:F0F1 ATP synthase subunit epsilon [Gramella sp. BOM4]|uniref:F0F1 ATP synthase subunit epsilon n=1 Tax=Christiangramia oceanisediminis TaxID=2920386 RepID=A0A9X2I7K0_9FLAO|nr:F0F1 ATP synthase subunit epsilon [Gramella oceanisediminis]MCP9198951.1 F0F1 ATP synthase subunit epsilon [Gramella oceanisediminis]MUP44789.1 F0F1 ATP synthase subunit epsilon [Christiangramia bathymodioli]
MYLEIVTPEAVVFRAQVDAVKVPGHDGEFQMLNNHAPIVSTLTEGEVKINLAAGSSNEVKRKDQSGFRTEGSNVVYYAIKGGVLEMKDNKAIVLAD